MIYLDNAATTKPSAEAVEAMCRAAKCFGNPSSLHGLGLESEKLITESREAIADILGVDKRNVFFTSGGTEANNPAVFGTAYGRAKLGKHVITTAIEHPSVLECFKRLENEGFEITYLSPDSGGRIRLDELDAALREDTTLVSVMHVNNETGVIQPVSEIKRLMNKSKNALLHCDCVQSFGKIDVKPKKWGADMISISAHKIHGFKGTGALYLANPKIKPLIYGGEQQNGIRPGTENMGGILAFGAAAKKCVINSPHMSELRNQMIEELGGIPDIKINGSTEYNSGSILNVSFTGIRAEILLHALEPYEIYVSTGSACSSHRPQPSHVLTAMGLGKKEIEGAVRISFDEETTSDEISCAAAAMEKEVSNIRRYMR
ncbi:MAG: cysteine desulfurase [Oscillospiraceae bacterium]|nr:cysteine desulfurase [Oscillospiraceae bacterium]